MTVILLRDAEIDGVSGLDLRVRDGRIDEIGPSLSTRGAAGDRSARRAVIPGLHDHPCLRTPPPPTRRRCAVGLPPSSTARPALAEAAGAEHDRTGHLRQKK
ncbi:hypothetical protein ACW9HQ_31520 [Nocardia gipuzkoensis]